MASRWMQPKLDKMRRDANRAPVKLFAGDAGKVASTARKGHTIERSNAVTVEVAALVKATYTGVVTVADQGVRLNPIGKGRRSFDGRTYGNGKRTQVGAAEYYERWGTGDRLYRNGCMVA